MTDYNMGKIMNKEVSKEKVLITGGCGYLGRNLYSYLTSKNCNVVSLAHNHIISNQKIVRGDVLKRNTLIKAMVEMDYIIHCAARMFGGKKDEFRVNSEGTRNVLDIAESSGVRKVIHISSLAVANESIEHFNSTESVEYPKKPINHYVSSKIEGENFALAKKDDINIIILRPGWIWGPGNESIIKMFKMIKERKFVFIGSGKNLTYFTYISNLLQAIDLALSVNKIPSGEIFNITDGSKVTMKNFVDTVASQFKLQSVKRRVPIWLANSAAFLIEKFRPDSDFTRQNVAIMSKNLHFDISKAEKVLGYRPNKDLNKQIAEVINSDF